MKYEIISSSSKGNCTIVEDFLMLDCGVSYSKIKPYLNKIKVIFISHHHRDHLLPSTIKKIAYNYPTIKFITGSIDVVDILIKNNVSKKNAYLIQYVQDWYCLGSLICSIEHLYHDVENYALKFIINGKKGIYIVDTENVDNIEAEDYDLFLIESNYNEELLNKHIQECEDANMLYYLQRAKKTHLSDKKCNSFLIENMGSSSEYCYLHQSSYNYEEKE